MKIQKFNEEEKKYSFYYYEIYDEYNDNIIGNYDEYDEEFDNQDLKDAIRYLMEVEKYNSNNKNRFHVRKVTYEQINEKEIEKIKKEIELEDNSDKYNM